MTLKKTIIVATFASLLMSAFTGCTVIKQTTTQADVQSIDNQPQAAELIPLEHFFATSDITNIKVSGDGEWVAFQKKYQGTANIFIMPKGANLDQAFPITSSKEPIQNFLWSYNDDELFFSKDIGGNENTQIYRLTIKQSLLSDSKPVAKITQLTNNNKVRYILSQQVRSDTSKLVVIANHDESTRLDGYLLDIESKKMTKILSNSNNFQAFYFSSTGKATLGVAMLSDNSRELFANIDGQWKSVIKTHSGEDISISGYDKEQQIAYISASIEGRDKKELLSLDLTTLQLTTLHKDPENESDVYSTVFNDDGKPLAVSYYGGRLRTYPLDQDFAVHWSNVNQHFTSDVEITITGRNEKSGSWQLHVASDIDAGGDYIYNKATGEVSVLAKQADAIAPELLAKRKSITYQARDGVTIQAYLTLPKGEKTNLPTIILPHGGPWLRVNWTLKSDTFNPVAQLLANRGYAVLQPNFRSSTGFGKHFSSLGDRNWGTGTMQHDLTDGAHYLIEQGIADKERLGIMGGSYGGYAALSGATFTPELFKAAISFCGPSNLVTLMDSFPDWARPYLGAWYSGIGDSAIPTELADMQSKSPLNFVDNITAPVLLIQGANDPRVVQAESDNMAKALAKKSLPVEYILAQDEGHGFKKSENMLAAMLAMEQFFSKHLGGQMSDKTSPAISKHLDSLAVDIDTL